MINLLKEVGRGKRGARDLSFDEALEAAEAIVHRKATPAQIGAFFIAERIKMESAEELAAFVHVCRQAALREPVVEGIDCAGPYDGRKKSFLATFATAFVLAAAGLPVTLHGTPSLPPKWGITLHDVLTRMGIDPRETGRGAFVRAARETGILYADAEEWCPPLQALRPIREELGLRTLLNTAEKLIDFSMSPYLAFGVYHRTVIERLVPLLTKLNYRKAMIVQGLEGSEDLFIERPTHLYLVSDGNAEKHVVDPEHYGLMAPVPDVAWTPEEQLRVTEAVLRGNADPAFVHQVLLNGAFRLYMADRSASVEEGVQICKSLLESGKPWDLYRRWGDLLKRP